MKDPVVIVGGGLAGLSAALQLQKKKLPFILFEGSCSLGGRVKTLSYQGFLLDKGFQVLQDRYPQIQEYKHELHLKAFRSGATFYKDGEAKTLYHPFKHPYLCLAHGRSWPFYIDSTKLVWAGLRYRKKNLKATSSLEFLQGLGLSKDFIHLFMKPFFGGVFLEEQLHTPADLLLESFMDFIWGRACLPQDGMGAIATVLSSSLPSNQLMLNNKIKGFDYEKVYTNKGSSYKYRALILALDNPSLNNLLKESNTNSLEVSGSQKVANLYFSYPSGRLPYSPQLHLFSKGPVSNLCFPSHIQQSYAPHGFDLISATVFKNAYLSKERESLIQEVKMQLCKCFSLEEKHLIFLKDFLISHALPLQSAKPSSILLNDFSPIALAGEVCASRASINGAIEAGKNAVEQLFPSREKSL